MTEKIAKPQLRFAGFDDTWEQRKFDEVFDCTVPNNTLSRAELSYDEGTVLNVHYGDVLIKYGSVLDVQKDDIPRIPHRCREDFNGALLQDGDVIIADTAEDETTGKACEIGNLQGSAIVSGLHTMVCRPRNRMALGYLGYYLNSNAYHHQLLPLMQGIKVLSLSRSNIQKTSVSYPIAVKEQQLIAYYFSQLDNLITLHQRKYDKLTNVKKSMLEKMFPKNGSNVPEIRFKGFSDTWEQRKLGDMMNVTSVKRIHQSDWTDSGVRFLRARDIVAAAKNEEPDDYLYISKEKYEEYSTLSGKVGVSDLLVTGVGTIGVPYLVRNLEPLYFKDGNIIWFQNSDKIDGKFLFYSFSAEQIQGFINESAGIGTVGTYTIESGKKTPISLPNQIEQAKVGEFFQQLDNLITLHQRELEKLKNLKKACLEKMFV
ncbi:MAG: restriction endonuclease subunit S [Dysosmobacter sp.]